MAQSARPLLTALDLPVRRFLVVLAGSARRLLIALAAVAVLAGWTVAAAPVASAHPLGNFTVNYYTGIRVQPHAVVLDLVVDRAEIPTLQAFPDAAAGHQPAGADAWRARECSGLAAQASLMVGGRHTPLVVRSSRLEVLPGAAGLTTSRLECSVATTGSLDLVGAAVSYQAAPTGGRVGWHEVTARGDGLTVAGSDVPTTSVSKELTVYPQDLLTSPLDQRTASFEVRAGSGVVAADTGAGPLSAGPLHGLDRFTTAYTDLVSRTSLTLGFALLAVLLSVLLGAMHAFAPGHGKTLMAAYLVGREGTWRQAAVIGLSVTVTHTIGVLLLGLALSLAALAAPEQVYPWLGLVSGLLLVGIGVTLLRSAGRGHVHGPGGHTHGPGGHTHGPASQTRGPATIVEGAIGHATEVSPVPAGAIPMLVAGVHTSSVLTATAGATTPAVSSSPAHHTEHDHHQHEHEHHHGLDAHHDHDQYDPHHVHDHDEHSDHDHEHPHDHDHDHALAHPHDHPDNHALIHDRGHAGDLRHDQTGVRVGTLTADRTGSRRLLSTWRLAAVGLVGGMVPSPSALLVLLGGIALGRAWFGAVLVLAYGAGMAAALVGTGLLLVAARDRFERWNALRVDRRALPGQVLVLAVTRRLPLLTAVTVIAVGGWVALRSVPGL